MITEEMKAYSCDPKGNYIQRNLEAIQGQANNPNHVNHGARGLLHMRGTLFMLFVAGTDTTATFMEWLLLFLAHRVDLQDKIFNELKDMP